MRDREMKLFFREMCIERRGYAGVLIRYRNFRFCVDNPNPRECDYLFYTLHHTIHAPLEIPAELLGKTYSPQVGNKVASGDRLRLNNLVEVHVVEAHTRSGVHSSGLNVGYVLTFNNGSRVYFTGDTELLDSMLKVEKPIHVLIIPIGGDGVMTPEEACEAVKSLKPVLTIPTHFEKNVFYYKFRDICQHYTQIVLLRSV